MRDKNVTIEARLARANNAIEVNLLELREYQRRYYELLEAHEALKLKHQTLYINTLNRGYDNVRQGH